MRKDRERQYSDSFYENARRSFSNTLWVPLIMLGATLLLDVCVVFYAEWKGLDFWEDPVISLLLSTLPMYLIGLPLGWLILRKMPKVNRPVHSLSAGQLIKFFPICMTAMYGGALIGSILQDIISVFTGIYPVYEVGDLVSEIPYWAVIVITVILGPVAEELVFRKLLIDRVQQYGTKLAIIFSGVSFGLFHGNITQCFYAAFLGMLFAYIYCLTGRIRYTILLHMLVNFFGGFLSLLATDPRLTALSNIEVEGVSLPELIYSAVIMVLAAVGLVIVIKEQRNLRLAKTGMELEKRDWFSTAFANAGFILLTAYFLYSTCMTYISAMAESFMEI